MVSEKSSVSGRLRKFYFEAVSQYLDRYADEGAVDLTGPEPQLVRERIEALFSQFVSHHNAVLSEPSTGASPELAMLEEQCNSLSKRVQTFLCFTFHSTDKSTDADKPKFNSPTATDGNNTGAAITLESLLLAINSNTNCKSNHQVRLPRMELPKFDGNLECWRD